jgi:hypothetical protein
MPSWSDGVTEICFFTITAHFKRTSPRIRVYRSRFNGLILKVIFNQDISVFLVMEVRLTSHWTAAAFTAFCPSPDEDE